MIEEKSLKKTFIIATLCSTLVGTFTSSIGLWDRVKDKRKQQHRDTTQDDDIKKLKAQVERSERRVREKDYEMERSRDRGSRDRGGSDRGSRERDDVGASFQRSGALISREFEDGYERLGRKFAIGDVVTENKLQAQVIALQQTVIDVLQDALYHGRQLDRTDMAKLVAASDAARDGSLGALREQRHRLLLATEETQQPPQLALGPPKRASTIVKTDQLFCRYSLELQYVQNRPLAASFAPGGDCQCPACGVQLAVELDDCWSVIKRGSRWVSVDGYKRQIDEDVEIVVDPRFVVKCHTPDGEYACVLCSRYRDGDIICATADALVDHVGRAHNLAELEREPDFQARELEKSIY
ncbi:hypothetical protein G7Z17_g4469 [Cylindrodendrum hubeiense]|uniref:Uncharacterized protein n=1 Tax=Cylindrodendrum hubeiense TaxID=595255 RepID=A0A9P5HDT4_9HYPO|nr:hypothetical protein G7Z17_g4469 [Cylindrodendrum hubeiense]